MLTINGKSVEFKSVSELVDVIEKKSKKLFSRADKIVIETDELPLKYLDELYVELLARPEINFRLVVDVSADRTDIDKYISFGKRYNVSMTIRIDWYNMRAIIPYLPEIRDTDIVIKFKPRFFNEDMAAFLVYLIEYDYRMHPVIFDLSGYARNQAIDLMKSWVEMLNDKLLKWKAEWAGEILYKGVMEW